MRDIPFTLKTKGVLTNIKQLKVGYIIDNYLNSSKLRVISFDKNSEYITYFDYSKNSIQEYNIAIFTDIETKDRYFWKFIKNTSTLDKIVNFKFLNDR